MRKVLRTAVLAGSLLALVPLGSLAQGEPRRAPATFQAFAALPAAERNALTPMSDAQLAQVQGSASWTFVLETLASCTAPCVVNIERVVQFNSSPNGSNTSVVQQSTSSR